MTRHIIKRVLLLLTLGGSSSVAIAQPHALFAHHPRTLHNLYVHSRTSDHDAQSQFISDRAAVGFQFQQFLSIETGALMMSDQNDMDDTASSTFYGIDVALKADLPLNNTVSVYAKIGPAMNMMQSCTAGECHQANFGSSAFFAGGSRLAITPQLSFNADIGANSFLTGPGPSTAFESDVGLSYRFS